MVVEQDERETTGLRAILNYGHTFAHALESVVGYGQLLHGEAVSIGMHMAACLALSIETNTDGVSSSGNARLLVCVTIANSSYMDAEPDEALVCHAARQESRAWTTAFHTCRRDFGHVELVPGITKQQTLDAIELANQITDSPISPP